MKKQSADFYNYYTKIWAFFIDKIANLLKYLLVSVTSKIAGTIGRSGTEEREGGESRYDY